MAETVTVPVATLQDYITRIFEAAGVVHEEAARTTHHLLGANLAGHDSHGIIRVPRYVQWLQEGKVFAGRTITVVTESPTHAVVDGNVGLGQTVAPLAVDLGIRKAKASGLAVVTLRNAGHIGRVGDWAERAAEAGLVSIHFVNVGLGQIVAPFGGVERRFGTNPFSIGVPQPGAPPLILDMATSVVAEGKVLVASNGGKPIPADALVTEDGRLSNDPAVFYGPLEANTIRDPGNGTGSLRAFGEHKGSGIAFMCEILAGCFAGSPTAGPLPGGKRAGIVNGMLSIYLDPAHFGASGFAQTAREFAEYVKASRPMQKGGEVLVPGEPEARNRETRLRDGIPLQADTWAAIQRTGASLGVASPSPSGLGAQSAPRAG
ncbi:MAG TPA: malate/lactate/ureidoglycolate dehydrogenase [Acetobacteraceae bacterium]|nr:malate/lactate/ureidoglycolate dehydrogenase [Acetobacteraceae bacterium]